MGTPNNTTNSQETVRYDLSGVIDPTVFAVEAAAGSTYRLLVAGAPKFYLKVDEGKTTNWLDLSGAAGISSAVNLGLGAQVLKNILLGVLQLRSITGSGGITVTQNANDIEISGSASSSIVGLTCDSTVAVGDLVVYVGATLFPVTDNFFATVPFGVVGLVTAKSAATICDIILNGKATGFVGLTAGAPLFLGVGGGFVHTAPATGTIQLLGFAINASDILFAPKEPIRRAT